MQLTGVGSVVEWVTGNQGATMEVAREDELDFRDPLLYGLRFRLGTFVVLFEVVWEVAVQVHTPSVVSARLYLY